MAVSAFAGPLISYGASTVGQESNQDQGTSLLWGGIGLLDQRASLGYNPGQKGSKLSMGWYLGTAIQTVDYTPSTLGAATLAASQTPVSGTALTLLAASAGGVTVGAALNNAITGARTTGPLLLIDGPPAAVTASIAGNIMTVTVLTTGQVTIGSAITTGTGATVGSTVIGFGTGRGGIGTYFLDTPQTVASTAITLVAGLTGVPKISGNPQQHGTALYNLKAMLGRCISITTAAGDTAIYTAVGYDIYGMPMTQALQAAGATTVVGTKAFKYLASMTPVGTVGATVSVGTADVFGFPLFSASFQDVAITWAGAAITAATGYLAGVALPATATTGDTRGTYAVQSASDGTKRLTVAQSPSPLFVNSMDGLYGVTQA